MAFISDNTGFISFAEFDDVLARDQRVFEANEGINDATDVEDGLIKSTNRILALLSKALDFEVDINLIIARQDDFTDICVYHHFYEQLLPKIADFGDDQNAERQKIDFYQNKFNALAKELAEDGDWYDYDADGTVTDGDNVSFDVEQRRVR